MKEKWIEDISAKMDGYEIDAPEISWSEIESKVAANRRPRIVAMWQKRIAVAASLLLVITASTILFFTREEQSSTSGIVAKNGKTIGEKALSPTSGKSLSETTAKTEGKTLASVERTSFTSPIVNSNQKNLQEKNKNLLENFENLLEVSENVQEISSNVQEISSNAQEKTENAQEQSKAADSHSSANKGTSANKGKKKTSLDYPEEFTFKKKETARLMASAYYGNGVNVASALSSSSLDPNIQQDAATGFVSGGDQCQLASPEEEPKVNADHHQPIRVGLSVKYALSERWGIETGLAYSYLRSDISEEKSAYTINSKQKVGYLGIPLAASYNIANVKPLHLYVLAGTMLEIPVMAKSDEAIVSSGVETTRQERSLSKSALQLSFSGRVGAEYNLTPSLGVYVEPGVSYYVGNGSSIETAYSDKPFNFNLNLGIRFTFHR